MILLPPPEKVPAYIAVNHIVALSLDRLPSGQVQACEVRQDEAGELRVPLSEMTTGDFLALAERLGLPVVASKFATSNDQIAHRQNLRLIEERAEEAAKLREKRAGKQQSSE